MEIGMAQYVNVVCCKLEKKKKKMVDFSVELSYFKFADIALQYKDVDVRCHAAWQLRSTINALSSCPEECYGPCRREPPEIFEVAPILIESPFYTILYRNALQRGVRVARESEREIERKKTPR